MDNTIFSGFVKRAMEYGYTQKQAELSWGDLNPYLASVLGGAAIGGGLGGLSGLLDDEHPDAVGLKKKILMRILMGAGAGGLAGGLGKFTYDQLQNIGEDVANVGRPDAVPALFVEPGVSNPPRFGVGVKS